MRWAYLATGGGELDEAGIVRRGACVDLASIVTEDVGDVARVFGAHDELKESMNYQSYLHCSYSYLCSFRLADLDIALEHVGVLEAEREGSNRHGLGNSTEIEDTLIFEEPQIVERVESMT